jgi:hypothetical protein
MDPDRRVLAPRPMTPLDEFCRDFAMSRAQFYREETEGRIHATRRGRKVLIPAAEYVRYYEASTGSTVAG